MATKIPVKLIFNDGSGDYELVHIYHVTDPKEGMKATVIKGTRGDGSIVIPGGKRSQEIIARGNLIAADYIALTSLMNEMRQKVTTSSATLTLKHYFGGGWVHDWSYTVRRINEIRFPQNLRTGYQEYEIIFFVLSY